ncbi:MAG: hypothetical protein KDA55_12500 [Planctomycetales bacterium]|nr:hypothetical protein [Planctomycetales bacterium]
MVDIPLTSQRPAAPASSGLTFLPETPANDPFGGLTPIGGADPLADFGGGGLTPVDGGLTPMSNDPFGGDPLGGFGGGGDPLGDLNQFGDLGSGAAMPAFNAPASFNPYAAPPAPVKQAKGGKSAYRGGGARRGLPWENRKSGRVDSPFLGTVKMVLFDSSNAFKAMKTEGGLGDPIGFAFMGNVIGNLATAGYAAVFLLIGFFLGGDADGGSVAALGIGIGQQFFMALVQAGTRATIGMFVFAGITHLLLMMVKGANRSYETTFRALAYSDGALAFCGVIPCLGALVQLIGMLIISIIAVMNAHETSGGKAAFAILMPILLCCVSVGVLVFLFIGVIGAIVSGAGQ